MNFQYTDGDCTVLALPASFEIVGNTGNLEPVVRGVYTVRRQYPASGTRFEGSVSQQCDVVVPCERVDYGASADADDDRCLDFETWKWGSPLACYHHKEDLFGDKAMRLYCIDLPSDMVKETPRKHSSRARGPSEAGLIGFGRSVVARMVHVLATLLLR